MANRGHQANSSDFCSSCNVQLEDLILHLNLAPQAVVRSLTSSGSARASASGSMPGHVNIDRSVSQDRLELQLLDKGAASMQAGALYLQDLAGGIYAGVKGKEKGSSFCVQIIAEQVHFQRSQQRKGLCGPPWVLVSCVCGIGSVQCRPWFPWHHLLKGGLSFPAAVS